MRAALGPRKSIGKRLNGGKVGRDDQDFRIFDGFHEISGLTQVIGLSIPGIIIDTQVMFSNAWVTSLEVIFLHILTDVGDPEFRICDWFHEISGFDHGSGPVDFRNHYQHPVDVFERLGGAAGNDFDIF